MYKRSRWSVGNAESEKGVFMEELLQVGVITSTHGVRGEVKVFPTTDDPNRFKSLKHVLLDTGREKKSQEVQGVKIFKQYVILKYKGIQNNNEKKKTNPLPLLRGKSHSAPKQRCIR